MNWFRFGKRVGLPILAVLICLLTIQSGTVWGQEIFGKILGTVTDPKNAVISGAKITITNQNTGVSATLPTDDRGDYIFTRVQPGVYTIRVENAGFRTIVQTGVTVSVAKDSRADFAMEVGAVTETVTVSENVKQVETTSIQLSASVPGQEIVNLPLVGRNWINLARTLPGVTAAGADRFGLPSVSGGRTQSNNYLINGIDYNDLPLNTPQAAPSPDSIAEFRIITNTMNPEYSRNSAATLNAITKTGTNDLHGTAFWFHRDHGLNANTWFNGASGARKPNFSQQQFGGVLGGPLYKNHTFWFVSYQGLRAGVPQDIGTVRVLTPAERGGTISGDGLGAPATALSGKLIPFQVNSTACGGATCPAGTPWSTAFPLTAGVINIPTSNFNPITNNILKDFPIPGTGQNTYSAVGTQVTVDDQASARVDQNWKKDQLNGYFFWRHNTNTSPFSFTGNSVPGNGDHSESFNRQLAITWVHTLNSTTINELRVGYNRLRFLAVTPNNTAPPSSYGFTGINPQQSQGISAPKVTVSGFTGIQTGAGTWGFSNNGPQPRVDATFQYADSFSKIWRGHNFKAGLDFRRGKVVNPFGAANNGAFTFTGTGPFSSGNPLVDLLLGVPDSYFQGTGALNSATTEEYYGYVQDTWQIRSNLSIVYGLGYQVDTPYQQHDNFDFAQIAFRPGRQSTVYPTAPPGILYTGDPGIPRGTVPTQFDNFGPRFGFVWSPSAEGGPLHWLTGGKGDFSIRAGFGIFYNLTEEEANLQFLGNPPLGLSSNGVNDVGTFNGSPNFANPFTSVNVGTVGGIAPATIANKFPAATAPPIGSTTFDFSGSEPFGINVLDPHLRTPKTMNFNLTIERQLKKDILLRVGYVGSQGRNLYNTTELNAVDTLKCATFAGCRALANFTQLFPGVTPFDGSIYGALGEQQSIATSHYNSFQLSVEKRLSHGLFMRGNYTYSKSLDNSSGLEDSGNFNSITPGNPKRDTGFSGFDARHIFTLTYDWKLPLPRPSNSILKHVLQSWTLTGVTALQSGFPVAVLDTSDRCLAGEALIFYETYCRPNLVGPISTFDPRASATHAYIADRTSPSSAFVRVPTGSGLLGNSPRNPYHGPGLLNFDFAVLKDTYITESKYIQFRGEFYNLFNHAQWNNPTANIASSRFGRISSTRVASRIIQLALKFYF
jgi:hypothetical protein